MRIGFAAQNCLDSFRHHTPTIIQVGIDCFLIQQQFTQTFQRTLDSNHNVTERYTDVTQHSRVCQVTLQAGNRQLRRKMLQNSICHPQVTLCIFEVDGVYFVRHSAGTDFARFNLLFEVLHRDVLPKVAVHVNHNGIDALHGIKDGSQIIIIRNLSSIFLTFQPQLLCHELISECFPVIFGISYMMCIVITRRTTEFSRDRTSFQYSQLTIQTINENHDFFTQASRRSRLPMCFCQHRDICPFFSVCSQLSNQLFNLRIVHLFQCLLYRQRYRSIVYVL